MFLEFQTILILMQVSPHFCLGRVEWQIVVVVFDRRQLLCLYFLQKGIHAF